MPFRTRPTPPAVLALALGACGAIFADEAPALRALIQDVTAPAMDRGLRDNDPPREPRAGASLVDRAGGSAAPYLSGSIIVKFKGGTSSPSRVSTMSAFGARSEGQPAYADFDIVAIAPDDDPVAVAGMMAARPDVEYAQPRYRNYPMFTPNDPLYRNQWNFPAIDMERAWDINPGASANITVAVLDTGLAYRSALIHFNARAFRIGTTIFPALGPIDVPFAAAPELGGAASRFPSSRDFIWDDTTPLDTDGHGTHVAGTIGQLTNNGLGVAGMAFNVKIMPVKVIDSDWDFIFNSPFQGTDDVVARGIRYAADNGAKVINMSIGRTAGGPATAIQDAIAYAISKGAFVAVAAGNGFEQGNLPNRVAEFAPQIEGMVAVGSVGRDLARAFYSSTGGYVELAAPGGDMRRSGTTGGILQQTLDQDVLFTYGGTPAQYKAPRFDAFVYDYYQGTSMATPHVSGFAAMLMQQGITNPAAVEAVMKRFATDKGAAGRDNEYGYGLINPRASLRGLGLDAK